MALRFFDEAKEAYASLPILTTEVNRQGPHRTFSDGRLGGAHEQIFYLRNDDPTCYYVDLSIGYEQDLYNDSGEFGDTGWGVKYLYGERRPTEAEWDEVRSGEPLALPNIGSTLAADTYTFHPIWIRVYCPGGVAAQIRENQRIRIQFYEKKVGAL
jgi:hypothetical protein